jgi:hypothetical protein
MLGKKYEKALVVAKKGRGKEMVWEGCEEVGKASPESSE